MTISQPIVYSYPNLCTRRSGAVLILVPKVAVAESYVKQWREAGFQRKIREISEGRQTMYSPEVQIASSHPCFEVITVSHTVNNIDIYSIRFLFQVISLPSWTRINLYGYVLKF